MKLTLLFLITILFSSLLFSDIQTTRNLCYNKKYGSECSKLGKLLYLSQPSQSMRAYRFGAKLEDRDSLLFLANLYWKSNYDRDKKRAIKFFERAESRRHWKTALFLAKGYAVGHSPFFKDLKKAGYYFERAALLGPDINKLYIAEFHGGKYGSNIDYPRSNYWYKRYINGGDQSGEPLLSILIQVGKWRAEGSHGFRKSLIIAQKYWVRAGTNGKEEAFSLLEQYNLDDTSSRPKKHIYRGGF